MPGLRDFFRSDAFTPASAVFPAIDTARLESDLSLASEGKARGKRNAPGPDETGLDSIETRIIARVGDLRRKGIDTYFENFRVYDSRLARAGDARDEVEIAASTARGDFQSQVAVWKARMATPMSKIRDAVADLRHFREKHRVLHIARQASFPNWFLIVLFVAVIEALANSLLFAKVMSSPREDPMSRHSSAPSSGRSACRGSRHLSEAAPRFPIFGSKGTLQRNGRGFHRNRRTSPIWRSRRRAPTRCSRPALSSCPARRGSGRAALRRRWVTPRRTRSL